ncbi:glycosyltransferase family 4 protein [Ligilactobacillus sp. LYQ135]
MNIGIFTDTYYPQVSGVATSIKTLRNQLERQGHNVYIFTTTDPGVDKNVFERNVFRFTSIPFVSFTDRRIAIRGAHRALHIAEALQLDIVHTQTEFSLGVMGKYVAKKMKIPCVHTYHTMYEDYLHYVANGKLLKPVHVKQISRTYLQNMSGIIAPSERVLNTLKGYGVKEPITVIPTGVDLVKFQKEDQTNYRKRYGLSANTPLLLTLSRLAYEKDIDQLIDAFVKIKEKIPTAQLMICGDGPAREDLEAQVKKLHLTSSVIFTGEIDNDQVAHYYHMADLFVSTSVSESQGLTYNEALASGLKVVTTHSPYTDELLDHACLGKTFSTLDEFVDDVVEYLKNPKQYHDPQVLAEKLKATSAERFGKRVVEFYQKCIAQYDPQNKVVSAKNV